MSNYRRLISYIYAYEGGVKGKNIGFAKLEARNGQCRISVNVKKVYVGGNDLGVYLLSGNAEILLGKIFIRNGAGEFRTTVPASNIGGSGCTLDECYGLTIHDVESTWQCYTTIWEDAVAHAAELELAEVTSEKQREKEPDGGTVPVEQITAEIQAEVEMVPENTESADDESVPEMQNQDLPPHEIQEREEKGGQRIPFPIERQEEEQTQAKSVQEKNIQEKSIQPKDAQPMDMHPENKQSENMPPEMPLVNESGPQMVQSPNLNVQTGDGRGYRPRNQGRQASDWGQIPNEQPNDVEQSINNASFEQPQFGNMYGSGRRSVMPPENERGSRSGRRPDSQMGAGPVHQMKSGMESQPGCWTGTRQISQSETGAGLKRVSWMANANQPEPQMGTWQGGQSASQAGIWPESQGRTWPGSQPGSQEGTWPESQPGSQGETWPGNQPESQAGGWQGNQPESWSGTWPGSQPESQAGIWQGSQPECQGGTWQGGQPEYQTGAWPGSQTETLGGTWSGSQSESPGEVWPGAQPESWLGSQPESSGGTWPGSQPEFQEGTWPENQPESYGGVWPENQPESYGGTRQELRQEKHPGISRSHQMGSQPAPQGVSQPASQPAPQAENWPESQAVPQDGSQTDLQTGMQPESQPESSSGPQLTPQPASTSESQPDQTIPTEYNEEESETAPLPGHPEDLEKLDEEEEIESNPRRIWQNFRKTYPKIDAFDYEKGCEVLTIKPQDIGLLPREIWVYGNNSFLLHGYYNYRYLILAKLNNPQGQPRYLLGVPGHYYSNEKYMASMFGFSNFVLAKNQPLQDGRFGYWYTDIRLDT